jgi:hypothetical protein
MASRDASDVIRIEDFACPGFFLECQGTAGCGMTPEYAKKHERYSWAGVFVCRHCRHRYLVCSVCEAGILGKNNSHMLQEWELTKHCQNQCHKIKQTEWDTLRRQPDTSDGRNAAQDYFCIADADDNNNSLGRQRCMSPSSPTVPMNLDLASATLAPNSGNGSSVVDDVALVDLACTPLPAALMKNWLTDLSSSCAPPIDFSHYLPQSNNSTYFEKQHYYTTGGASSLVARAFYGNSELHEKVHPADCLFGLMFQHLCATMTGSQRLELGVLLNYIVNRPTTIPPHYFKPKVPINAPDFRSMFGDGVQSILNSTPRPPPHVIGDHVYFSPVDIIAYLMAHGQQIEPLFPGNSVHSNSERGKELLEYARKAMGSTEDGRPAGFVLPLILWEDDLDTSNVKQNKNKVSVCLMTAATPQDHIHSSCNTYIVWLGPGNADHSAVEERRRQDLKNLRAFGTTTMANGKQWSQYTLACTISTRIDLRRLVVLGRWRGIRPRTPVLGK